MLLYMLFDKLCCTCIHTVTSCISLFPLDTTSPPPLGSQENPAQSCADIPSTQQDGMYYVTNSTNSSVEVYCDTDRSQCSCNTGGFMRVADFHASTDDCPDGFQLLERNSAPTRLCRRNSNTPVCRSVIYPTHGVEYSRVCGRIIGYQWGKPNAFDTSVTASIDEDYLDGFSLTHGSSPRSHIWSFAASTQDNAGLNSGCPCTTNSVNYPSFVGEDYFCESGRDVGGQVDDSDANQPFQHHHDALWNGRGCSGIATSCCDRGSVFCKTFTTPTTDDIELRLCLDDPQSNNDNAEDIRLERVEIYVQ